MSIVNNTVFLKKEDNGYVSLWSSREATSSITSVPATTFNGLVPSAGSLFNQMASNRWYSLNLSIADAGAVRINEDTTVSGDQATQVLSQIANNRQAATTMRYNGGQWQVTIGTRTTTAPTIKEALAQHIR